MDDFFFSKDLSPTNLKDSFDFTQDDEEYRRAATKNDEDGSDDLDRNKNNNAAKAEGTPTLSIYDKTPSKSATGSNATPSRSIFSGLSFFKSLVSSSKTVKGEGASRKSHSRNQSLDSEQDLEANIMGPSTNTTKFATPSQAASPFNSDTSNSKKKSFRHSRSHSSNSSSYFFNDIYGRRSPPGQRNSGSGSGSGSGVIEYQESPLKAKDDHPPSFSCSVENICFDFIR